MRKFLFLFFVFLILVSVGLVSLVLVIVEDQPAVEQTITPTPQSLRLAKDTVKQINRQLKVVGGDKLISIPQQNLTAMFSLLSDLFNNISARHNSMGDGLIVSGSIQLPENPVGRFINVSTFVSSDYSDTETGRTSIGGLSLSNRSVVWLLSKIVLLRVGDDFTAPAGDLVYDVSVRQDTLYVQLNPDLNTASLLANVKSKGKETLDVLVPVDQFSGVQAYYDHLVSSTRYTIDNNIPISFSDYLKLVMEKAGQQSASNNATDENISALLAVGMFAGDYKLRTALNSIVKLKNLSGQQTSVVLANRKDLNLHFIYSAILTILSNQGITISIGEIKEVSDSAEGGSGFSFVDIAADRAGVKLAQFATGSEADARLLQHNISQLNSEAEMFPDISYLQEGLSEEQFNVIYQSRESADYKIVIDEIDRRIDALRVYRP